MFDRARTRRVPSLRGHGRLLDCSLRIWNRNRFALPSVLGCESILSALSSLERVLTSFLLPFLRSTSQPPRLVDLSSFSLDLGSPPSFVPFFDSLAPSVETNPSRRPKPSNPPKPQQSAPTSSSGSSPRSLRSRTSFLRTREVGSSSSLDSNPERSSTGRRGGSTSPLASSSHLEPSESWSALPKRLPS